MWPGRCYVSSHGMVMAREGMLENSVQCRSRIASTECTRQRRPAAKGQPFGFGPRFKCPFALEPLLSGLADQLVIGEALADDLPHEEAEAIPIVHRFAVVEAESLLVNIAEQVEGLNADVGP